MISVHFQLNPSDVLVLHGEISYPWPLHKALPITGETGGILLSNLSSWTQGLSWLTCFHLVKGPSCLTVGALRTRAHSEYCFSEIISKYNQQAARMWKSVYSLDLQPRFWLGNAAYSTMIEKHSERIEICLKLSTEFISLSLFKIKTIKCDPGPQNQS